MVNDLNLLNLVFVLDIIYYREEEEEIKELEENASQLDLNVKS